MCGPAVARLCVAVGVRGFFWWWQSVAGWPVCFLAGRLDVTRRVLRFFGSCGWGAGVQALGSRLDPPVIEARRDHGRLVLVASLLAWGCLVGSLLFRAAAW